MDVLRMVSSQSTERGFCAFGSKGLSYRKSSDDIQDFIDIPKTASVCWIDYLVDSVTHDSIPIVTQFGFSDELILNLLKNKRSGYEDFETEMGLLLPAITAKGFDVTLHPLLILIKDNLILTIHTREVKRFLTLRRYGDTFIRKLPLKMKKEDKITLLFIRIIDENNSRNFDHLLELEEFGDNLSKELADPKTPRTEVSKKIFEMKHALITYLQGLWATVDVLSSVRYGDANVLSDDEHILDKITALNEEVNSHIGLAEHLSEVLASGLEVVQSIYNNQLQILNNRLALLVGYLTIIGTAFMVPNTLATAMGSSIFTLGPEDMWWYLTLLVGSTIVSTIIVWYFVRRAGYLPKRPNEGD
jgi:magnesium transporter